MGALINSAFQVHLMAFLEFTVEFFALNPTARFSVPQGLLFPATLRAALEAVEVSSVRGSGAVCPGSLESPVHMLLTAVLSWVSLVLPQWPPVPAYYILEFSRLQIFFNRFPLVFHGHTVVGFS